MLQVLRFVWLPFDNFAFHGARSVVCALHSCVSTILEWFAVACWLT